MTGFRLGLLHLVRKPTATAAAVFCVFLAVVSSGFLGTIVQGATSPLRRIRTPFDLIIGPKSSGLDVLLGGLGVRSPSTDVLPFALSEYLDRRIFPEHHIPLHAWGRYAGSAVFGTDERYLERPDGLSPPTLASGRWFQKKGEAVVGGSVAESSGLVVGDRLEVEGLLSSSTETWRTQLEVVGILSHPGKDPMDRTVLTNLETGWDYYRWARQRNLVRPAKNDEVVTYLLVALAPGQESLFRKRIHGQSVAQLVDVKEEIRFLHKLLAGAGLATAALCVCVSLLAVLGIVVFVNARFESLRPELGLLRALGYPLGEIAVCLMTEAVVVTGIAVGMSICLEGVLVGWMDLAYRFSLTDNPSHWPSSWNAGLWGSVFMASILVSVLSLIRLFRQDPQRSLSGF